jgi:hypothetical protein
VDLQAGLREPADQHQIPVGFRQHREHGAAGLAVHRSLFARPRRPEAVAAEIRADDGGQQRGCGRSAQFGHIPRLKLTRITSFPLWLPEGIEFLVRPAQAGQMAADQSDYRAEAVAVQADGGQVAPGAGVG